VYGGLAMSKVQYRVVAKTKYGETETFGPYDTRRKAEKRKAECEDIPAFDEVSIEKV
jgi:hypothetical protein